MNRRTLTMLLLVVGVAGCDTRSDQADLEAWMAAQRSEVRPRAEPVQAAATPPPEQPAGPSLAQWPDPFSPGTKTAMPVRSR